MFASLNKLDSNSLGSLRNDSITVLDVAPSVPNRCIVVALEYYNKNYVGVLREFVEKKDYKGFTKRGLNAGLPVWKQVRTVLSQADGFAFSEDRKEIIRIPLNDKSAAQIYTYHFNNQDRIAIGRLYNYKDFHGFAKAVYVEKERSSELLSLVDQIIQGLEASPTEPKSLITEEVPVTKNSENVPNDYSELL